MICSHRQDRDEETEIELRKNDGSVTTSRSSAGGSDKAAGPASGERSLESGQKWWLNENVGKTAKGDENNEASRCRRALYEGNHKSFGRESPGSKEASCLGNPAGGFGLSWLNVVLGMKTMPPQIIFVVPFAGERPRKRPCTAQRRGRSLDSAHVKKTQ